MSPMQRERDGGSQGPRNEYLRYAGAGIQFALTFLVFGAAGWWLDGRLGSAPWLMVAGIALGATGAFISLVRRIPPAGASARKQDRSPNP